MRLSDFKVLTFDCYGTLIDWESGIFEALHPLLARANPGLDRDAALEAFARHETAQEVETPGMLYSALLARVQQRLAEEWGVAPDTAEAAAFGASVPAWPAFPDSAEALRYLKQHYALVVLSNVDRQSFAGSNARLGVEFDAIYTAQDIGTYKPDPRNFDYMLKALAQRGIAPGQILHTAQSLFHDHVPARAAGLNCAWIDRRHAVQGWGATMPPPVAAEVQFRFRSLSDLAEAHRAEQATA
jgi:2-haloalkanoic acid dehalogenase type II